MQQGSTMREQTTASYAVRAGYVYTDASGAAPRTYAAGEVLALPTHVGDAAHQLERGPSPSAQPKPARQRPLAIQAEEGACSP